jgi:hypothetical protein
VRGCVHVLVSRLVQVEGDTSAGGEGLLVFRSTCGLAYTHLHVHCLLGDPG